MSAPILARARAACRQRGAAAVELAALLSMCPEQNIINCAANSDGAACIRSARVRLCVDPAAARAPVPYVPTVGIGFAPGTLNLPNGIAYQRG
jgi:hypothetical protein